MEEEKKKGSVKVRASRAEITIEDILRDNDMIFEEEYTFPGLVADTGKPLRFDFAVFEDEGNIDFLIEYQGRQHYQAVGKYGGRKALYSQQYNDNKKRRFCALNHITLVEIPFTDERLISFDYILKKAYGD